MSLTMASAEVIPRSRLSRTDNCDTAPQRCSALGCPGMNIDEHHSDGAGRTAGETLEVTSLQLASVKLLLSSEREVAVHDLLLATAFEYLDSGPRTSQEIASHLESVWPGIRHSYHAIEQIMRAAEQRSYVTSHSGPGSMATWALAERGRLDLEGSREWANDVLARAEAQIERATLDHFGRLDLYPIQRWTEILIDSVSTSLAHGFAISPSQVDVIDNLLIPAEIDLSLVDGRLGQLVKDPDILDFLRVIARASLDPSSAFGSELIHHLTLGYILHAFTAGFDNPVARAAIGSLNREVFILDTPVLLEMAGSQTRAEPVVSILARARESEVRVVVLERTIEELQRVLFAREYEATSIEDILERHEVEVQHLRASLNDQVLQLWLSSGPEGLADWLPWSTFCTRCERTISTVQALGGEVGVTTDQFDDVSQLDFEKALKRCLDERGGGRGDWHIAHDAEMLVNLKAFRSSNPTNEAKIWPGATIVSPDTYLVDSYRTGRFASQDGFPAAITMGQWAAILARCCDPVAAESLAEALSCEVSAKAALNRSVTVPLETAIEIARSLKSTSISDVALTVINMSVDDILESEAPSEPISSPMAQELAAKVLAQRHRRLERATQEHRDAAANERREAEKHRIRRETQVEEREKAHQQVAEQERERSSRLETENKELQGQIADERAESTTQIRRVFLSTIVCLGVLGAVIILYVSERISTRGLAVGLVGTSVLVALSIDCYRNRRSWYEIGIPAAVNAGWLILEILLKE